MARICFKCRWDPLVVDIISILFCAPFGLRSSTFSAANDAFCVLHHRSRYEICHFSRAPSVERRAKRAIHFHSTSRGAFKLLAHIKRRAERWFYDEGSNEKALILLIVQRVRAEAKQLFGSAPCEKRQEKRERKIDEERKKTKENDFGCACVLRVIACTRPLFTVDGSRVGKTRDERRET